MVKQSYCLSLIILFFFLSCKFWNPIAPSPNTDIPNIVMIDDISALPDSNDAAAINKIELDGFILKLNVSYSGGCKTHDFRLFGLKGILKSNPPQAVIHLYHNAHSDLCEAYITENRIFNLLPLNDAYQQLFFDNSPLLLRIYAPNSEEPFQPLPLYKF